MIFLILVLGLLLRLININQSLWLDEAISTLAARDYSYYGITFDFLRIDNHPPLFYLLLKFWGLSFGFSDWVLRVLPIILGSAVAYFGYQITLKISENKKLALIAALLISTSPLLIYYSQEIRMYILITLLAAVQILVFQNILQKSNLNKWILFSFLNCLLFFSDYITVFFFPVFLIYPIIKKDLKLLIKTLLSFVPLGILFTLWFPMFNAQLSKNNELVNSLPGWQFIVGGATIKNLAVIWMKFILGRISFEPKIIYYSLIVLGSIPILTALYLSTKQFRKNLLIWIWLIAPLTLGFLFSFIIPAFNYFRFIYVLPALLILVTLGAFQIKKNFLRNLVIGLILLTNAIGLGIYYLDPSQQRENWRQVVDYIEANPNPNSLVVFEFYDAVAPYRWYTRNTVEVIGAHESYFANELTTPQKLTPKLADKNKIYYFEYLRDLTDPQRIVEKTLETEGFKKTEVLNDFKNIGQLTIWKR